MGSLLDEIKNEIKKSGTSKGKFLYFKEGTKIRVRFLTDFEDGLKIPFHDSFELNVSVPCQELFGRECEYCENESLRTRNLFAWSVYDVEAKETKILMQAVNQCTAVGALATLYETYGTLLDRDYVIKQTGSGTGKSFSVVPLDKSKFKSNVKALSKQAILKYLNQAYPADNNEPDKGMLTFDEEEENPKSKDKKMNGKMNEPEDIDNDNDDWGEEEEPENYDAMKPSELYKLCIEREIACKKKKPKDYYINLLEIYDEDNDDWGE